MQWRDDPYSAAVVAIMAALTRAAANHGAMSEVEYHTLGAVMAAIVEARGRCYVRVGRWYWWADWCAECEQAHPCDC